MPPKYSATLPHFGRKTTILSAADPLVYVLFYLLFRKIKKIVAFDAVLRYS